MAEIPYHPLAEMPLDVWERVLRGISPDTFYALKR